MPWDILLPLIPYTMIAVTVLTMLEEGAQPKSWIFRFWMITASLASLIAVVATMINPRALLFLLPATPLVGRVVLVLLFLPEMKEQMTEEESDRQEHRTLILALAGFSFSGVLGLLAYGNSSGANVLLPSLYAFISFLAYLLALNVQAYKATRWQDQAASSAVEIGTLSLVLCVVTMFYLPEVPVPFRAVVIVTAACVLGVDYVIRLTIWSRFLGLQRRPQND